MLVLYLLWVCLVIGAVVVWGLSIFNFCHSAWLMNSWKNQQSQRQGKSFGMSRSEKPKASIRKGSSIRQPAQATVNFEDIREHELRRKLVTLLRGNNAAAERLVDSARRQKPFMGDVWYLEKVIFDLERDRFR
jgi:hypothetical protein